MRPVPRVRLLVAKAIVAGVLIWAATILVALAALVAGLVAVRRPRRRRARLRRALARRPLLTAFELGHGALLLRVGDRRPRYVAFGFTALLALGTLFSTLTDTAASAIGATVGVYIVSEILDGISQLGRVRYVFPTHYLDAWESMFTDNRYSHDMIAGIVVQLAYLVVFGSARGRVVPAQGHPLLTFRIFGKTGATMRCGTGGRRNG